MINPNFVHFCYWKSSNFMGKNFENTCVDAALMDNFTVCHRQLGMSKQVHHGAYCCNIEKGCTLNYLKC